MLTGGLVTRALMQALLFLIVARVLTPVGYGQFVSILAVASTLSHLSGFGAHILLVRDVSRDATSFSRSWGIAILLLVITTPFMVCVYIGFVSWLFPSVGWIVILSVGVSEILFLPCVNLCAYAYQGFSRMGRMSRLIIVPVLFRSIAAVVLLIVMIAESDNDPLRVWSTFYAVSAFLAAFYAMVRVRRDLPAPVWSGWSMIGNWVKQGVSFSITGLSVKLYGDSDKIMLASLNSVSVAGVFSAGHRFIDLAMLPIYGLLGAIVPRLFQSGQSGGPKAALAVMKVVAPWWLGYAVIVIGVLWILGPWVTLLLGDDYAVVSEVIRWMSLLPLFSLPRHLFHYVLNTSDRQGVAMRCFMASAIINIILNVWWIPLYGWKGALAASYFAELLAAMLMLIFVLYGFSNISSGVDRHG